MSKMPLRVGSRQLRKWAGLSQHPPRKGQNSSKDTVDLLSHLAGAPMPRDPYIREKFTRLRITAKKFAAEYFERFPKDRYQTEVESWRHLQSDNIEFTMKRLREPIETDG
jgi:hypothetical protein